MSWDTVLELGSISFGNSSGSVIANDKEAITTSYPSAASGMLFRLVIVPKSLDNFLLTVNVVPGTFGPQREVQITWVRHKPRPSTGLQA